MSKVLVLGYYFHGNLGDETYKYVMKNFLTNYSLTFAPTDSINEIDLDSYYAIIVGGGDIVNDYFIDKIRPKLEKFERLKIAFSIGIPFPNLIKKEYLSVFDHIYTRNYEDLRAIQKVQGAMRIHFIPDIALSLPNPSHFTREGCSFFLVGNLAQYPPVVDSLTKFVTKISKRIKVTLYCFNSAEDSIINQLIYEKNPNISVDNGDYTPYQMLEIMAKSRICVCTRYHAHIFSIVARTPFLSISSSRKTRSLMTQAGLKQFQVEIELDGYFNPVSLDYKRLLKIYRKVSNERKNFLKRSSTFLRQSRFLLSGCNISSVLDKENPSSILRFIQETKDTDNAARIISYQTLGTPESSFNWGIIDKLNNSEDIESVVDYSWKYLKDRKTKLVELIRKPEKLPIYVNLDEYSSYRFAHRGGWYHLCEKLAKRNSIDGIENGVICDMYVDKTFHWAYNYNKYLGRIPYTSPWMGFIHHTYDTTYSSYNTAKLFTNQDFIRSLHTCLALFTLSEPLSIYVRERLVKLAPKVKVFTFVHPIDNTKVKFDLDKFLETGKLVHIGAWMRNPLSIYTLSVDVSKSILIGPDMKDILPPENFSIQVGEVENQDQAIYSPWPCRDNHLICRWLKFLIEWLEKFYPIKGFNANTIYLEYSEHLIEAREKVNRIIESVEEISRLSNTDYDILLSHNVVFLDLIDAAAVNTVIECIIRNTPVIINKIPGTIAILGENYPLFYSNLSEVQSLLSSENLLKAVTYLDNMDKEQYSMKYFLNKFEKTVRDFLFLSC